MKYFKKIIRKNTIGGDKAKVIIVITHDKPITVIFIKYILTDKTKEFEDRVVVKEYKGMKLYRETIGFRLSTLGEIMNWVMRVIVEHEVK